MSFHRVFYGLLTLLTLLLYRNTFTGPGGGLAGLGIVLGAGAVGTLLAAVVTPWAVRRVGKAWWVTAMLAVGGAGQLLGLLFTPPAVVVAGSALGFVAQAVKICVDTTLQEAVDDDFRGRVFSVYDTLFNVTFVAALLVAAAWLPSSGRSPAALVVVGAGYLLAAAYFARWCLRRQRRRTDVLHPGAEVFPEQQPVPVPDRREEGPGATAGGPATS
jgi:MFS family permease